MRANILNEQGANIPVIIICAIFHCGDNIRDAKQELTRYGYEGLWPDNLRPDTFPLVDKDLHNWLRFLFSLEPKDDDPSLRETKLIGAALEVQRAAEAITAVLKKDYKI